MSLPKRNSQKNTDGGNTRENHIRNMRSILGRTDVKLNKSANAKVYAENDTNIIELRPSLPYKDDQWSPINTSGKKVYDKEFLLALRNDPKSRKKPENLLDVIAQEDKGKLQSQQPVFPTPLGPFLQSMTQVQPIYRMPYYGSTGQRPAIIPQYFPGQTFTTISYPQTPQKTQTYLNYPQYLPRGVQPPVVASSRQNISEVPPLTLPLPPASQQQVGQQRKRRANAIPIIDRESGRDKLDEIYVDDSHPPCGESSAWQTPQPQDIPNKEVRNTFNKQVNMVINQEKMNVVLEQSSSPSLDQHIDLRTVNQTLPPTPQTIHISNKELVQTSKLQLSMKELFQVKNKTNGKLNAENDTNTIELRPSLPYKNDQWSPVNTTGKKVYDKEFLLALRNDPKSRKKPENLPDVIAQEDRGRVGHINQFLRGAKPTHFTPNFSGINYGESSLSNLQKSILLKRNNQQGKSGGNAKENKTSNVISSTTVRGDVNLNKSENAKVNAESDTNIIRLSLPYKDDQWSPINTSGKKVYDKEFLLALRNDPKSRKKPENLPAVIAQEDRGRILLKRNNQQGKNGGNAKENKTSDVISSTSVRVDVNLNKSENAKVNAESETNIIELRLSLPYKDDQWSPINTSGKKVYDKEFLLALRNDPKSRKKPENLPDVIAQEDRGRAMNAVRITSRTDDRFTYGSNTGKRATRNTSDEEERSSKIDQQLGSSYMVGGWIRGSNINTNNQQAPPMGSMFAAVDNVINDVEKRTLMNYGSEDSYHSRGTSFEDQWSPVNTSGKKVYDKEFLLALRNDPKSRKKPENLPAVIAQEDRGRVGHINQFLRGGKPTHFTPNFSGNNYGESSLSNQQKSILLKRNNQQGKNGGNAKENKTSNVISSTSVRVDVNLNKSENAKVNAESETNIIELRLSLPYKDDQWSPVNTSGKRVYDKKFLLALRNDPKSRKKPENLPDVIAQGDRGRILLKRNNQQGKNGGNAKENKTSDVISSTSVRVDVNLNKSESAKVNAESETNIIELRLSLPYKDDQWSPVNTSGKKVYDKEFLLALRNDPKSRKKPENLPDVIAQENRGRAMNTVRITSRKDDRPTYGSNTGKRATRNTSDEEERSSKIDQQLGSGYMFGGWLRGSNIKTNNQQAPLMGTRPWYPFAALENVINDVEKRSLMNYGSEDSYHSMETSFEGRESRSSLQHRPHESSLRSKPIPSQQNIAKSNPQSAPKFRQAPAEQISFEKLDQLERKIKNILEEYLNDCCTVDECDEDIRTSLPPSVLPKLVSDSYMCVLLRSKTARERTGRLIADLIKRSTLSIDSYCIGLEKVLSQVDDLTIDISKIWNYLAEILAPIINEDAVSLVKLHKSFDIVIKGGHTSKLLGPLFKLVITEKGPNHLHSLWQNSGITIFDFMDSSQANDFIQVNKLEFLLGVSNTVVSQNELTYEQIHIKLLDLLKNENSLDDVFRWIDENVGERTHEKQFVRTLATAVFENSIVKSEVKTENLRSRYPLLIRFIGGRLEYELECLYALQALINKLEHPQGILLSMCSSLYDDGIISYDCFVKWETSDEVAE